MYKTLKCDNEVITRPYGQLRMLAGGRASYTANSDLRILEIVAGTATSRHYHNKAESIFHILEGEVEMEVERKTVALSAGDTVVISPGETHMLRNIGTQAAFVVESMSPPFSKEDTLFLTR